MTVLLAVVLSVVFGGAAGCLGAFATELYLQRREWRKLGEYQLVDPPKPRRYHDSYTGRHR